MEEENEWRPVGNGTPLMIWLETGRKGEVGTNICLCRIACIGDEPEWIEFGSGRTTVTHHSFAAPTHWRWNKRDLPFWSIPKRGAASAAEPEEE